jgi:hypothetical protein
MNKPTLYVALKGPLLVPSQHPNEFLGAGIADYAKAFLTWASGKFDVQVLTDENPRHVFFLADHLGLHTESLRPRGYELAKTELMHPNTEFYWVDSELIPSEVAWLARHGHVDRFLSVDPTVGVIPRHREALEGLTRSAQRTTG